MVTRRHTSPLYSAIPFVKPITIYTYETMGKTDFASFRKFILMYDLSKKCNKEIAFELSFCYRDLKLTLSFVRFLCFLA